MMFETQKRRFRAFAKKKSHWPKSGFLQNHLHFLSSFAVASIIISTPQAATIPSSIYHIYTCMYLEHS
jgi:hypothetical protein